MGMMGQGGGEELKKINEVLTAPQQKRFKEINIQAQKERALNNPDVQKELGLSDAQKTKLRDIQTSSMEKSRPLMEAVRNQEMTMEEMRAQMQAMQAETGKEILKVLTDAQAKQFKAMAGVEFKFDPNEPLGGGRRRNG